LFLDDGSASMVVRESARRRLFELLRERLDMEGAELLLGELPAVEWDQVVTKREMNARFDRVDERFERVDDKFRRVDEKFDEVTARLDRIDRRLDKLTGRFLTAVVSLAAAAMAAVVALAAVVISVG
jgi:uncharacterized protein YdcH (DUF465 family)